MAKLSINETTTFRWSLEEDVVRYATAGVPAIGVWRTKLSDCGLPRATDLLARHGLEVSHLHWAGGFTGSDGRSYRESIADAVEAVQSASALRAGCLIVYTGPRAGHTFNHAARLVRDALAELIPVAEEHGVTLAIEPMHPGCAAEWTFLTSLGESIELLDALASPAVKLVFDTYHLGHEPDLTARIAELGPRVALVQLGDAREPPGGEQNRCRLGEGVLPLGEIVAALREFGYDGYFDVELLGEAVEPFSYESLIEHAKQGYNELIGTH